MSLLAEGYGHLVDTATRFVDCTSVNSVDTTVSTVCSGRKVTEVCLQIRQVGRVFPSTQRQDYQRKPLEMFRRVRKIVKSDC